MVIGRPGRRNGLTYLRFTFDKLLWFIALVIFIPLWNVVNWVIHWILYSVPGLFWALGSKTDVPLLSIPLYVVLVAACSFAAVVMNLEFLRFYAALSTEGDGKPPRRRDLRKWVWPAAGVFTVLVVGHGFLFMNRLNAVTFGAFVASGVLLLVTFAITVTFNAKDFHRRKTAHFQSACVAGGLAAGCIGGAWWVLA